MIKLSDHLDRLVQQFSQLPGIGQKTAHRLAYFILKQPDTFADTFAEAVKSVKALVKECEICHNITDDPVCRICSSSKRNPQIICVVEEPTDVIAIEKTNDYHGVYHVLGGAISPLDGVTPDHLHISSLLRRLQEQDETEVILAMNPDVEGEATTLYLVRLLKAMPGISLSRIARGVPMGGDLEYADQATLAKALEGRVKV